MASANRLDYQTTFSLIVSLLDVVEQVHSVVQDDLQTAVADAPTRELAFLAPPSVFVA